MVLRSIDARLPVIPYPNLRGEFESSSPHGTDITLVVAAIPKDSPRQFDAAIDRRLGNHTALPDRLNDFVAADHPAGMAQKEQDEIEDKRLDVQDDSVAPQLISVRRELKITELIPHSPSRSPMPPGKGISL